MRVCFGQLGRLGMLWLLALPAFAEPISEEEYRDVRTLAGEIHRNPNAVVIGIGRSPTPLIAFLQAVRPGSAYNLPLSEFRYGYEYSSLTPREEEILFRHFDRFVPSREEIGDRPISLVDYSYSGMSLLAAHRYLKKYLTARKRDNAVETVAMTANSSLEGRYAKYLAQLDRTLVIPEGRFRDRVKSRKGDDSGYHGFDDFSEYPGWDIYHAKESPPKTPRPEYLLLRDYVKILAQKDPDVLSPGKQGHSRWYAPESLERWLKACERSVGAVAP